MDFFFFFFYFLNKANKNCLKRSKRKLRKAKQYGSVNIADESLARFTAILRTASFVRRSERWWWWWWRRRILCSNRNYCHNCGLASSICRATLKALQEDTCYGLEIFLWHCVCMGPETCTKLLKIRHFLIKELINLECLYEQFHLCLHSVRQSLLKSKAYHPSPLPMPSL